MPALSLFPSGINTSDATMVAADLAAGKTGYAMGTKVTGISTKKYGTGDTLDISQIQKTQFFGDIKSVISIVNNAQYAVTDGQDIYLFQNGSLQKYHTDGTLVWSVSFSPNFSNMWVDSNGLYVYYSNTIFYKIDKSTGATVWSTGQYTLQGLGCSDANYVYLPTKTGLMALNQTSGNQAWSAATGSTTATICVADTSYVYASIGNKLTKLNKSNGSVVWQLTSTMGVTFIKENTGHIFCGTYAGASSLLLEMSTVDGSIVWQVTGYGAQFATITSELVICYSAYGNYEYAQSDGTLVDIAKVIYYQGTLYSIIYDLTTFDDNTIFISAYDNSSAKDIAFLGYAKAKYTIKS